jgi:hypothetical protein
MGDRCFEKTPQHDLTAPHFIADENVDTLLKNKKKNLGAAILPPPIFFLFCSHPTDRFK